MSEVQSDFHLVYEEGFDLSSSAGHASSEPRKCYVIRRFGWARRHDYTLIAIDPPFRLGALRLDTLIVVPRHQGESLLTSSGRPVDVHIARVLDEHALESGEFDPRVHTELIGRANVFGTEREARDSRVQTTQQGRSGPDCYLAIDHDETLRGCYQAMFQHTADWTYHVAYLVDPPLSGAEYGYHDRSIPYIMLTHKDPDTQLLPLADWPIPVSVFRILVEQLRRRIVAPDQLQRIGSGRLYETKDVARKSSLSQESQ